jgi:hypothetical protein
MYRSEETTPKCFKHTANDEIANCLTDPNDPTKSKDKVHVDLPEDSFSYWYERDPFWRAWDYGIGCPKGAICN